MNKVNLRILESELRANRLPKNFSMVHHSRDLFIVHSPAEAHLGSFSSALGMGPCLNRDELRATRDESWPEYSARVYGVEVHSPEWYWLFSDLWSEADNTPGGAADRIDWALRYGVPDNPIDQSIGAAPLCCYVKSRTPPLTRQQKANLLKLADYLSQDQLAMNFDMSCFMIDSEGTALKITEHSVCGTAACAIGHGPSAGVSPKGYLSWIAYREGSFGIGGDAAYNWLFSDHWDDLDNTAIGASLRIRWFLDYGVPENLIDQLNGEAPLCYKEESQ